MSSGVLYADFLAQNANTVTAAVPAGKIQTADAILINMSATPTTVQVWIGTNNSPADNKTIVDPVLLNKGGKIRIGGAILAATEKFVMLTDGAQVSARISCFEEDV